LDRSNGAIHNARAFTATTMSLKAIHTMPALRPSEIVCSVAAEDDRLTVANVRVVTPSLLAHRLPRQCVPCTVRG
jgi:hypothetical protein